MNHNPHTYAQVQIESNTGVQFLGKTPLTVFEDTAGSEARLTLEVTDINFSDTHALDQYLHKNILIRQAHGNGVEFVTRMYVTNYERRLDSKSSKVVHVFNGTKTKPQQ